MAEMTGIRGMGMEREEMDGMFCGEDALFGEPPGRMARPVRQESQKRERKTADDRLSGITCP